MDGPERPSDVPAPRDSSPECTRTSTSQYRSGGRYLRGYPIPTPCAGCRVRVPTAPTTSPGLDPLAAAPPLQQASGSSPDVEPEQPSPHRSEQADPSRTLEWSPA